LEISSIRRRAVFAKKSKPQQQSRSGKRETR
jgi:hypothetical protein